jgi:ATP-dependent Lhr-like helicase
LIEQMPTGEIILAPIGEAITHAKEFYAAFTGVTEYSIRHGQLDIGKLPEDAIPPEGEHLLLNGRRWKVEVIDSRAMVVEVIPARGRKAPVFGGTEGEIHNRIVAAMRDVLHGESTYAYLQADAAKLLGCVRVYASKLQIFELPWLDRDGSCVVFPWTGSKGMQTLRACAQADRIEVEMESISINYRCDSNTLAEHFARISEGQFDVGMLATAIGNKHRDKFDRYLPEELLDYSNSRRLLSLKDAVEAVKSMMVRAAGASK